MSRAHRRGTYAGSPISTVASAALAVKLASTDQPAVDPAHRLKTSLPSSPGSKLWQRAAEVGVGAESEANGTVRHVGFNVVEAIRALHGVSVTQLKQRLDDRAARMEEVSPSVCGFEFVFTITAVVPPQAATTGCISRPVTSPMLCNRL